MGYRVFDGAVIGPIGSEEERHTIARAFSDLGSSNLSGGRDHLPKATSALSAGDFPGSARESIHAVESVIRVTAGEKDFAKALAVLEKKINIHGALKERVQFYLWLRQ
jgi:hypothetical protein